MSLLVDLNDTQMQQLREKAQLLGLSAEELIKAVVSDLLSHTEEDFAEASKRVLSKNQELYERLS